jgi:hypothetical protein
VAVIGRDLEFQHVVVFFILNIDFVCLYTYEFLLSLCKIARSSVILLLPLFMCIDFEIIVGFFYFLTIIFYVIIFTPSDYPGPLASSNLPYYTFWHL